MFDSAIPILVGRLTLVSLLSILVLLRRFFSGRGSPVFLPPKKNKNNTTIRKLQFDFGIKAFMESRLKGLPSSNIDYSTHCGNLVAIKYSSFTASVSFSLEETDFSLTNVVLSVSRKEFYICKAPVVNNIKQAVINAKYKPSLLLKTVVNI